MVAKVWGTRNKRIGKTKQHILNSGHRLCKVLIEQGEAMTQKKNDETRFIFCKERSSMTASSIQFHCSPIWEHKITMSKHNMHLTKVNDWQIDEFREGMATIWQLAMQWRRQTIEYKDKIDQEHRNSIINHWEWLLKLCREEKRNDQSMGIAKETTKTFFRETIQEMS